MLTINFPKKKTSGLQKIIDKLEQHLENLSPDDKTYAPLVKELSALYVMKKGDASPRVSPDVLIQAGAGLIAVLVILHYEQLGVVTSKAMSFVKLR